MLQPAKCFLNDGWQTNWEPCHIYRDSISVQLAALYFGLGKSADSLCFIRGTKVVQVRPKSPHKSGFEGRSAILDGLFSDMRCLNHQ